MIQEKNKDIVKRTSKLAFARVFSDVLRNKIKGSFLLFFAIILFLNFDLSTALNWTIFIAFLLYGWENRIIAFGALACLASCPVLLSVHQDAMAEKMAVQVYLFLVMAVVLQLIDLNKKHEVVPCEAEIAESASSEKVATIGKKQKMLAGAMVWLLTKASVIKKEERKKPHLLLGCILLLVIAGIFLHWSLMLNIFSYAFVSTLFFPKKMLKLLPPISLALLLSSLIALAFSQKDWASVFYLWMFLVFALMGMAILIEFLERKITKSKC